MKKLYTITKLPSTFEHTIFLLFDVVIMRSPAISPLAVALTPNDHIGTSSILQISRKALSTAS